jgi:hypothetical protein
MDTETPRDPTRHGAGAAMIFITSLCAAIVVGGGFGIVIQAFILAAANYFSLGHGFVWVASAFNALGTAWLTAWTFARSWHVERRLRAGLDIDEPKLSIFANLRG